MCFNKSNEPFGNYVMKSYYRNEMNDTGIKYFHMETMKRETMLAFVLSNNLDIFIMEYDCFLTMKK